MTNLKELSRSKKGDRFIENLSQTSLKISDLPSIRGDGNPGSVEIKFLKNGELTTSTGQFFVELPEVIANDLPGSYISPETFLGQLSIDDSDNAIKRNLLGDGLNRGERPIFEYREEDGSFNINVFNGSTNENALALTRIASKENAFTTPDDRILYQTSLFEIVRPVLKFPSKKIPSIHIIEDCVASGDTIMGVLAALNQKTKIETVANVRIDVAVATAQGALLIREFARDNNGIRIELNVGHMAFGLSEGVRSEKGKGLEHANYITYPPGLLETFDMLYDRRIANIIVESVGLRLNGGRKLDKDIFVVGDMGDAGRSVNLDSNTSVPWNKYRRDPHGVMTTSDQIEESTIKEGVYPTIVYLANGGYLMRAFYHHLLVLKGMARDERNGLSEMVFDAKRRFDENSETYGVLLSNIDPILIDKI